MKKQKKICYHEHETPKEGSFPNLSNVASVNECTGLMFTPPKNEGELEAYEQLSSMEIPREKGKKKDEDETE